MKKIICTKVNVSNWHLWQKSPLTRAVQRGGDGWDLQNKFWLCSHYFFFVSIVTTIFSFSDNVCNIFKLYNFLNTQSPERRVGKLWFKHYECTVQRKWPIPWSEWPWWTHHIIHIQTVKLRIDGSMLFSLGLGQNQKLWSKAEH